MLVGGTGVAEFLRLHPNRSLEVFGATTHWRLEDRDYATATAKRAMREFKTASRELIDLAARQAGVDLPGQCLGR
jgi:hypothetical protein